MVWEVKKTMAIIDIGIGSLEDMSPDMPDMLPDMEVEEDIGMDMVMEPPDIMAIVLEDMGMSLLMGIEEDMSIAGRPLVSILGFAKAVEKFLQLFGKTT